MPSKPTPCIECGKPCASHAKRCKPCAQRHRWRNPNDPRREALRDRNEAIRAGHTPYQDREWLRVRYEDRLMSLREIALEGECGERTIARWMAQHQIAARDKTSAQRLYASTHRGPASPSWRGGKHRCIDCGEPKGSAGRATLRCRACSVVRQKGAGNPNWRGVGETMPIVRQWLLANWRPAVFARDGYTCQECGDARGRNLNAHHIEPLAKIMARKRRTLKPALKTPEDRVAFAYVLLADPDITTIENGVTLCAACHEAHHLVHDRPPGRKGYR